MFLRERSCMADGAMRWFCAAAVAVVACVFGSFWLASVPGRLSSREAFTATTVSTTPTGSFFPRSGVVDIQGENRSAGSLFARSAGFGGEFGAMREDLATAKADQDKRRDFAAASGGGLFGPGGVLSAYSLNNAGVSGVNYEQRLSRPDLGKTIRDRSKAYVKAEEANGGQGYFSNVHATTDAQRQRHELIMNPPPPAGGGFFGSLLKWIIAPLASLADLIDPRLGDIVMGISMAIVGIVSGGLLAALGSSLWRFSKGLEQGLSFGDAFKGAIKDFGIAVVTAGMTFGMDKVLKPMWEAVKATGSFLAKGARVISDLATKAVNFVKEIPKIGGSLVKMGEKFITNASKSLISNTVGTLANKLVTGEGTGSGWFRNALAGAAMAGTAAVGAYAVGHMPILEDLWDKGPKLAFTEKFYGGDMTLTEYALKPLLHGAVQGGIQEAFGGEFLTGFGAGVAQGLITPIVNNFTYGNPYHSTLSSAISSAAGGLGSYLGGGDYATGSAIGGIIHRNNDVIIPTSDGQSILVAERGNVTGEDGIELKMRMTSDGNVYIYKEKVWGDEQIKVVLSEEWQTYVDTLPTDQKDFVVSFIKTMLATGLDVPRDAAQFQQALDLYEPIYQSSRRFENGFEGGVELILGFVPYLSTGMDAVTAADTSQHPAIRVLASISVAADASVIAGVLPNLGTMAKGGEKIFDAIKGVESKGLAISLPNPPTFKIPDAPRTTGITPEIYQASLRRFNTPTTTAAGKWEIANTGRFNYTVTGGGTKLDVDGIIGTTIQEAKFITNASRSPFIPGSKIPDLLRTKIVGQVDDEFARMSRIIADPSNPLRNVEVIINNAGAERFFLDMLKKHGLNGRVIIR